MTLAEITAKLTGLDTEIAVLKADKATASSALEAEITARKSLESKLASAEAELAKLKATASAAPPPKKEDSEDDENEEASVTDAIKALENAITVLKGIAGQGEADPDDETTAEDGADMADDTEAAKAAKAKDWKKVFAIRSKQVDRKKIFSAKKSAAKIEKITTEKASVQLARMGIPMPIKIAPAAGGATPLEAKRAEANSAWFANIRK